MLTSDALPRSTRIAHGFFSRDGGVSKGVYASLNCGNGSNDAPEHVAENRARASRALGAVPEALSTLYQIHSAAVVTVTGPISGHPRPRADAMVSDRPGALLGILTADCAPVLFADAEAGVIGAAHAGWKGALDDIMAATVEAMEALGARRAAIRAAVGPCIAQSSYEVGPEFHARFVAAAADHVRYFMPSARPEHHHFDLEGFVCDRLRGLELAAVEALSEDTCTLTEQYFSYRRATKNREPDYGRGLSAIALKG